MNGRSKKIAFSSVSVFVVLAMLVGITMAWFSDTEKTNARFHAGVLNIEVSADQANPETGAMDFVNLRPIKMQAFHQELGDNFANRSVEGFDPVPKYFHPVTISNAGSLPAQVGNAYQATHIHSNLVVGAGQADQGADIGGGAAPDPQPQEKFVTVQYCNEADG